MMPRKLSAAELGALEGARYAARVQTVWPLAAANACGAAHLRAIEAGRASAADAVEFGTAFLNAALG